MDRIVTISFMNEGACKHGYYHCKDYDGSGMFLSLREPLLFQTIVHQHVIAYCPLFVVSTVAGLRITTLIYN